MLNGVFNKLVVKLFQCLIENTYKIFVKLFAYWFNLYYICIVNKHPLNFKKANAMKNNRLTRETLTALIKEYEDTNQAWFESRGNDPNSHHMLAFKYAGMYGAFVAYLHMMMENANNRYYIVKQIRKDIDKLKAEIEQNLAERKAS